MKQQAEGGAGIIGAAVFSVNVVGEEKSFNFVRLVIAIQKFAQAASQK